MSALGIEHRTAIYRHQSSSQPSGGDFVRECWTSCREESENPTQCDGKMVAHLHLRLGRIGWTGLMVKPALLVYFLAQNLTNLPSVQNRGGGRKVQDRADLD